MCYYFASVYSHACHQCFYFNNGDFFCNIWIVHLKKLNCKSELFSFGEANILVEFAEETND